ncbi:hypothetical protein QBC37DRAFT_382009 [Rhypophila decipiens]|uniref:Uncharacterized protein n=1 Tax=Rhypophila decipiens TaxID=261697 RepID=A0AAN7BC29_9PEZI|nr:hypothetical protein QBC37DRAFT_382009 [Rhypophila decipiens]
MGDNLQFGTDASDRSYWLHMLNNPVELETPTGTGKTLREFPLDERLWYERMIKEENFYMETMIDNLRHFLRVQLSDDAEEINDKQFKVTCNKSVGIYISSSNTIDHGFKPALWGYIYRRWYRPYENDLDSGPFLAKLVRIVGTRDDFDWLPPKDCCPNHDVVHTVPERPEPPRSFVNNLVSRHNTLCQRIEELRKQYMQHIAELETPPYSVKGYIMDHERYQYVLQPLFQALIIGAFPDYYLNQTSRTIGNMFVFLIRTGVEEGLSAPITFDSLEGKIDPLSPSYSSKDGDVVKVSLETAIDFVQTLEIREMAVYGPHPDGGKMPISTKVHMFDETTQKVYTVEGPRVDFAKHPDWIHAPDRSFAERDMNAIESRARSRDEKRIKRDWKTFPGLFTETH